MDSSSQVTGLVIGEGRDERFCFNDLCIANGFRFGALRLHLWQDVGEFMLTPMPTTLTPFPTTGDMQTEFYLSAIQYFRILSFPLDPVLPVLIIK